MTFVVFPGNTKSSHCQLGSKLKMNSCLTQCEYHHWQEPRECWLGQEWCVEVVTWCQHRLSIHHPDADRWQEYNTHSTHPGHWVTMTWMLEEVYHSHWYKWTVHIRNLVEHPWTLKPKILNKENITRFTTPT